MFNTLQKELKLTPAELKTNLLGGLTVALSMTPEAIAFALIAHVSPLTGLYAAFMVSLITSIFGGRPGMISGAAGALAVVMVSLMVGHGVQYLFATVVLMGVLQLLFAWAKLGKFIRMVPYPVMLGFVNGLAIVTFVVQFGHFKTLGADGLQQWMQGMALYTMLGLIALTMLIIYLLPRLSKAFPATLAGVLVVSVLTAVLGIKTKTVGDLGSIAGGLPTFALPNVPLNLETLYIIFPYALILAAVGLIESLLTLNLIDEMTDTRGQPNRESMAQGIANVVTGFFGGMGGCAMIGQSMINVNSGALRRLSGVTTALFLLSFILFASPLIERIPLAALIGVMFVVAEKTFEWGSLKALRTIPKSDALLVVGVTVITVFTDLAIAVVLGVVFAALIFAWNHARQMTASIRTDENGWRVYNIEGTLFFASVANFQNLFDLKNDPQHVVAEFRNSRVADHSAVEAIEALAARYQNAGKILHLRHLSPDCLELLDKAKNMVEVNTFEDPHYHIADNKLG
ncbi:Bicarbonate transporter BicA [Ephemeroptericola cinctiostellae]|uniref:Bicarbonate transporter BicA n=1 Tax=Ephemeroptericola cinctiostellae TaxID=2268024 RepID=A0A345DBT5_9BURK|nr:SulP family inorganic anion transporter [Ephemeroptericola cinctiostellae]AXF85823.1 Bicarbonate transporter BicA [Ephemeroptericola cinctiostellae]